MSLKKNSNKSNNNKNNSNKKNSNKSDNNKKNSNKKNSNKKNSNKSDNNKSDNNKSDNNKSDNNKSDNNKSDNNKSDNNKNNSNKKNIYENIIKSYYYSFNKKPINIKKECKILYTLKKNGKQFDIGSYGFVSEVCKNLKCKYVVKTMFLQDEFYYKSFLREALIAPMMGKHKIGPKIYDIFICLNIGYIIMEKWNGSIRPILHNISDKYMTDISELIVKMHQNGVVHNDLHTGNILYKIKNKKYHFAITDYGLSSYFENKKDIIPDKFIPFSNMPNCFFPAFDFYKLNNALESKKNIIFITFFFNNNYISLFDYLIIQKFYEKSKMNDMTFDTYIKSIKLNI